MANSANVFAVAVGHDQTALVRIVPQPWTNGLQYPEEVYAPTDVYEAGEPFVVMRFNAPDGPMLDALYAAFGLTSSKTANVTISLPTNRARTTWADYNGQAVKDVIDTWQNPRYGQVQITVRLLEAV